MAKCESCRDGRELPFRFKMAFQPIVDVGDNRIWGYETLVRGPDGQGAHHILSQVTDDMRYRFDQAARVMAIETAGRLFCDRSARLSINFMPNAVYEPNACIQQSLAAARRADFPTENLMFEFTEDERMVDPAHVERIVRAYRELGFMTALDDFGAGYAGLSLLARLHTDVIKLDMELIRDVDKSSSKQIIVGGLVEMARQLEVRVLAEASRAKRNFSFFVLLASRSSRDTISRNLR
ncbi:MAG: EAL domain-containing protein [Acidobacteriaceae bacterium]|nr:EAL domain-containing protein [Acidobacteriaceae bacterium]